jgi:IS5 family transposase
MNNLTQNYEIILKTLQENCSHITGFKQIRTPELSNLELAALNLTAEYMMHNSELQLFNVIKGTYLEYKIERSVYNKRRRKLFQYIENIRQCISSKFSHLSNVFIVDSAPVEICEPCRAKRSNICATDTIQPNFGFCPAKKAAYFGYKLHLVCDENAIVHSFDFTPANVHDVNYLKDVKYNLNNCEIIGDRGYISAEYQMDLFNTSQIKLTVPARKNQHNQVGVSALKRRKRKRIETLISQLDGQFSMNKNFAKTFEGLVTRILSKITTLTIIQFLNLFVFNRNINKLKINLC